MPFALPGQTILTRKGRRVVVGGETAKTYADWQVHIATRATGGELPQLSTSEGKDGVYRSTLGAGTGGLFGSSWMSFFYASSSSVVRRIVQHGMPSLAVFDAQVSEGREVIFRLTPIANQQIYTALGRNGFTSTGGDLGEPLPASVCDMVGWWDEATKTALMMNPQAGAGPVPYTAPGW